MSWFAWLPVVLIFIFIMRERRKRYLIQAIEDDMFQEIEEWRKQLPVQKPTLTETMIIKKHAKRAVELIRHK